LHKGVAPQGRPPDENFMSVLYLIMSVAGGIVPQLAKFGHTKIPNIPDWISGFGHITTRHATSMKDVIIFRWVCSGPFSKTYEDNLRAKLSIFLVPKTKFKGLDPEFLAAIGPYLGDSKQKKFRMVMEKRGEVDEASYAKARDDVLQEGPLGFYANT